MTRFARGPVKPKQTGLSGTQWSVMKMENLNAKHGPLEVNTQDCQKNRSPVQSETNKLNEQKPSLNDPVVKEKQVPSDPKKGKRKKKRKSKQNAQQQSTPQISEEDAEEKKLKQTWKNMKRTQIRQENRQRQVAGYRVCFKCREAGHTLQECPQAESNDKLIQCYKCGSTEHRAAYCAVKLPPNSYPFAKCFICCETGHIAGQCPDNPKGIYPNGGSCKHCQSVEHMAKDCPIHLVKLGIENKVLSKMSTNKSIEGDSDDEEDESPTKRKKVATF